MEVYKKHAIIPEALKLEEKKEIDRNKSYFLICGSCFWSATCFDQSGIEICPSCMEGKVESMPLSIDEICELQFDERRGVTLEFKEKR
jgi:hypothetical protein